MEYLARYGELALKSEGIRKKFENTLSKNTSKHFKNAGAPAEIILERGRILVKTKNPEILKNIIGITSFSPIVSCGPTLEKIKEEVLALAKEKITPKKTFRMTVRREWKEFPKTSQELEKEFGEMVRKKTGAKGSLKNPDVELTIEIRQQHAHLYTEKTEGIGGMPSGSSGRVVCILDTNESLLAAFLALRRGCAPIFLAQNPEQAKALQKFLPEKAPVYTAKQTASLKDLCAHAEKLAKQTGALAIITGENMIAPSAIKSELPVIRPLAGFDADYWKKYAEIIGVAYIT